MQSSEVPRYADVDKDFVLSSKGPHELDEGQLLFVWDMLDARLTAYERGENDFIAPLITDLVYWEEQVVGELLKTYKTREAAMERLQAFRATKG